MDDRDRTRLIIKKSSRDAVFFASHFLINPELKPYKLEPQQKLFLRDRSPYKIFFCSRRSGKSLSLVIQILWEAFFNKNYQILLLAPTEDQAKSFAETYNDMIFRSPLIQSSFISQNKRDSQLANGSRVAFKTAGAASGRAEDSSVVGSGPNLLLLDEAQSLPSESLNVILPVLTGQTTSAHLILAGTPRNRSNFFYNAIMNSKQVIESYVDNGRPRPCKKNGFYSLHKFQITELDEDGNIKYSRVPHRLTIEELELMKESIGVQKFEREYCLQFLDTSTQVYYNDLQDTAGILKEPTTFSDYRLACAGLDVGKTRNNSVLSVAIKNDINGTWELMYFKAWDLGTDYKKITHYINNVLLNKFPNLQAIAVDKTGVGNAIFDFIDENLPIHVYGFIFSQPSKIDLAENCIRNLESKYVTYYPHPKLKEEMEGYAREETDAGRIVYTKDPSDDFIDSFNLTNMAITKYLQDGPKRVKPFYVGTTHNNVLNDKNYRARVRRKRNDNTIYRR